MTEPPFADTALVEARWDLAADEAAYLAALGLRVRAARRVLCLTRRQLAERSGVSERYLAQVEAGDGNLSVLRIRRLARVLGVPAGSLLSDPADRAEPTEPAGRAASAQAPAGFAATHRAAPAPAVLAGRGPAAPLAALAR